MTFSRFACFVAAVLLVGIGLSAKARTSEAAVGQAVTITMTDGAGGSFYFSPAFVTATGEVDVWFSNPNETTHNAKSYGDSGPISSGDLPDPDTGKDEYFVSFKSPGVYSFYCTIHGTDSAEPDPSIGAKNQDCGMCGQITVRAPATPAPTRSSAPAPRPSAGGKQPTAKPQPFSGVFFTPVPSAGTALAPLGTPGPTPELATASPLQAGTLTGSEEEAESNKQKLALIAVATFLMAAASALMQRGFLR